MSNSTGDQCCLSAHGRESKREGGRQREGDRGTEKWGETETEMKRKREAETERWKGDREGEGGRQR